MKTYILNLEPNDDLISVRDKMGWAKSNRILIVWPKGEQLLNRRLDLLLLQRKSQELGSQLALVCKDSEVRYHAPRLGIVVFTSLRKAQTAHWRLPLSFRNKKSREAINTLRQKANNRLKTYPTPPPGRGKPLSPVARLLFFTAGVFSLLAIAATLVPNAQLALQPKTILQDVILEAYTDPSVIEPSLLGAVPSSIVFMEVEGRDSVPVSGSIQLPYQSAQGYVTFKNLTDQEIEIHKGTVVRPTSKSAMRYATSQTYLVSAGVDQSVEIAVRCLLPGTVGNLPANSISAIEGKLGTLLSAANPEPIVGGTDRIEPAPTQADRTLLTKNLSELLLRTAEHEIKSKLSPGDFLITDTIRIAETLEQKFQPDGVLPADQLSLSWRIKYEARVIKSDQLMATLLLILNANLPSGYQPMNDDIDLEIMEKPQTNEGQKTVWKVHATRILQASISEAQAIQLTIGIPAHQAAGRLMDSLPITGAPQINLQPTWWPRMPILPFRIQIKNLPPDNIIK